GPGRAGAKPPPAPADPRIGTTIGRCRIRERVGRGRTAVVYRAEHVGLGRDVALKVLLPEVLEHPEVVSQFENEARALARLDHPNLVKVYDVLVEGDTHCIVMEFLEGESVLDYVMREGRLETETALRVVRHSAAGLQAAHARGLIHRDVKPQNLVILEDGSVRLVDFGLATAGDDPGAGRIGTPHYMAPEVCEARAAEPASDVYGLGITLYHLLVGQPPHAGKSIREILAAHIEGKPLQPEREVRGLPPAVADLVRQMTKRDPLTRPTIEHVIATLDRIGGDDLVRQPAFKPRSARRKRAMEARAARKQTPGLLIVGIAVGVVLVGVLVASRSGRSGSGEGDSPTTTTPEAPTDLTPPATPTPEAPGTAPVGPTPATPSDPSVPPPESEDARRAREAAEALAAEKARQERARVAFAEIEAFARANWQTKAEVVRQYRTFTRTYSDLPLGKEAKRRADGIEANTIHPHPERTIAPPAAVDSARAAWDEARGKIEAAVTEMRYEDALRLMPQTVEDPEGKLADELSLWRLIVRDLTDFHAVLGREAASLKGDAKAMTTPKGAGTLITITSGGPQVRVGTEAIDFRWVDFPPAEIAALAQRAFAGKDVRLQERLAGYAWAHKVRAAFFQAAIGVKTSAAGSSTGTEFVDRLLARAQARFPK
ncbi:MAG TPA: serine/threonine-protein kinase, partial [Planctomycetota bacterium]|nr:serine/threonine-protein kinase [Planctomycetota bacterium]